MANREILTLQLGHYSNFVGTHWWNLQELGFEYDLEKHSEINHDVLFREGLTNNRQITFTPRVLISDLKGSLQSLPEKGTLYETLPIPTDLQVEWNQPPEVQTSSQIPKNSFQHSLDTATTADFKLEDDVNVWSDFMYSRLHPRSINVIKDYEHKSELTPFNTYPMGSTLWKTEPFQDEYTDKIRNYIEECDNFQGFQILMDCTDGFAGLGNSCIEYLSDEFETKTIFALPLIPSHFDDNYNSNETFKPYNDESIRVLNIGFCYNALFQNSSLFVPLCTGMNGWREPGPPRKFNHVNYNDKMWYHSSAILAAALDTFSLNYRLKNNSYTLSDLAVDLSPHGKAAAASLCLPFSINNGVDLIDCLDNWDGPLTQSITPRCKIGDTRMMQLINIRGISADRLKRPVSDAKHQKDLPAYKCNSIKEMLSMYYAYTCHASATNVTNISKGLTVKCPYPAIFDKRVGYNGNIISVDRPDEIGINSIPVLTGLHAGVEIGEMLETLHTDMRKIRFNKIHQFTSAGIEFDEYNECLDKLFDYRELYEDKYLI